MCLSFYTGYEFTFRLINSDRNYTEDTILIVDNIEKNSNIFLLYMWYLFVYSLESTFYLWSIFLIYF